MLLIAARDMIYKQMTLQSGSKPGHCVSPSYQQKGGGIEDERT